MKGITTLQPYLAHFHTGKGHSKGHCQCKVCVWDATPLEKESAKPKLRLSRDMIRRPCITYASNPTTSKDHLQPPFFGTPHMLIRIRLQVEQLTVELKATSGPGKEAAWYELGRDCTDQHDHQPTTWLWPSRSAIREIWRPGQS